MQTYTFDCEAQIRELLAPLKILDQMMEYYEIYQEELQKRNRFLLKNTAKAKHLRNMNSLLERDIRKQLNQISKIIYILPMNCRYYIAVSWIYEYLRTTHSHSILTAAKYYQEEFLSWQQKEKKLFEKASLQSRRFKLAFQTFHSSFVS